MNLYKLLSRCLWKRPFDLSHCVWDSFGVVVRDDDCVFEQLLIFLLMTEVGKNLKPEHAESNIAKSCHFFKVSISFFIENVTVAGQLIQLNSISGIKIMQLIQLLDKI